MHLKIEVSFQFPHPNLAYIYIALSIDVSKKLLSFWFLLVILSCLYNDKTKILLISWSQLHLLRKSSLYYIHSRYLYWHTCVWQSMMTWQTISCYISLNQHSHTHKHQCIIKIAPELLWAIHWQSLMLGILIYNLICSPQAFAFLWK